MTRIQNLHRRAPWQFIAPSETALTISTSGSTRLQANPEVIAHGEISFDSQRTPQEIRERKLRIAFVGQPVHHKGWGIFQQFVNFSMVRNQEVDFFHFGSTESHNDFITFVNLTQTSNKIGLTTALLLQHQIDAVFVWSIHQETFNLVTYESMAAGCAIIARHSSGNIAAAASRHDRGILYTDGTELFEDVLVFERVLNLVNTGLPTGQFVFTGTSTALKMGGAS